MMKKEESRKDACPIDLPACDVDMIDDENEMAKKEVQL